MYSLAVQDREVSFKREGCLPAQNGYPKRFLAAEWLYIIYREGKLMPEIFMEHAGLKQIKTLSLPNVNTPFCQVGI